MISSYDVSFVDAQNIQKYKFYPKMRLLNFNKAKFTYVPNTTVWKFNF